MKVLVTLPITGSGCDDVRITYKGADLTAEYECGGYGMAATGAIQFDWAIAHRFRNEQHSRGFLEESYDCLIEISNSKWLSELEENDGKWRHFAVFFSNIGYLEVIARDFRELPSRPSGIE